MEDSCQFQLCGQEYSDEFGVGQSPAPGSCSGDCHSLAVSLVTNKFTKDFLWAKCSAMCLDKYNFSQFRYNLPLTSVPFSDQEYQGYLYFQRLQVPVELHELVLLAVHAALPSP